MPETPASTPTPSREPLTAAAVADRLRDLSGWTGDHTAIERVVQAATFLAGIRLVDAVAELAEAMDHHPDIDIRWCRVRFALSTRSSGGVTETDLVAAAAIDALVAGADPPPT